jgi:hypothetical protein
MGEDWANSETLLDALLKAHDQTMPELHAHVKSLERQLDTRQGEIHRRDNLLAHLMEREPQQASASDTNLEALIEELRSLRGAVENLSRQLESLGPGENHQLREVGTTWRGLFLGPREDRAPYKVWPSYIFGVLLIWVAAAFSTYLIEHPSLLRPGLGGLVASGVSLHLIVAFGFGVYAGIKDGGAFKFWKFLLVGVIAAIGATVVVIFMSVWANASPQQFIEQLLTVTRTNTLHRGAVFVPTLLLFISGVKIGRALQLWGGQERQRFVLGSGERRSARDSGAWTQAWLGFAGTVLGALITRFGS